MASSVQTEKLQISNDSSSCQSAISDNISDCVIPAINFSLKKNFAAATFYNPVNEKLTANSDRTSLKFKIIWLKFLNEKVIRFKPIRQKQFQIKLCFATEKYDHQLLF